MLARSRLISLSLWGALLGLAGGCQPGPPGGESRPTVRYEAMTQGSPPELIAHLRQLRDRFKASSAEDLQSLREGTAAYTEAVVTTADAVLASKQANPNERHEAAEAELRTLARTAEADRASLDRFLVAADRLDKEPAETGIFPVAAMIRFDVLSEAAKLAGPEQKADEPLFDKLLDAVIDVGRAEPPPKEAPEILKQFTPVAEMRHRPEKARLLYELMARHSEDAQSARFALGAANRLGLLGKPIGPFAGPRLVGEGTVDLESLKGKVVLVDFWASWCGPCMAEIPALKVLRDRLAPQGFEILGVSIDMDPAAARAKAASMGMDWPLIDDRADPGDDPPLPKLGAQFGTAMIPLKLLIDREGRLVASGFSMGEVDSALAKLIPEAVISTKVEVQPPVRP